MEKKRKIHKLFSLILTIAIMLSLFPVMSVPADAAATNRAVLLTSQHAHKTLNGGYFYYINETTTISAAKDYNGLVIGGTASSPTFIYIPTGKTLYVYGGSASSSNVGGKAAILLGPTNALVVLGGGTLRVQGGAGYSAGNGAKGGDAVFIKSDYNGAGSIKGGSGGSGGQGGSGGGAGIGTNGGRGGAGGVGQSISKVRTDHPINNGKGYVYGLAGGNGSVGGNVDSMGTLYKLGNVAINAYGGSGGVAGARGAAGDRDDDVGSRFTNNYAGGGGGGGAGGAAGQPGNGIGTGGPGGGGGGAGGTGGMRSTSSNYYYSGGSGGKGAVANGEDAYNNDGILKYGGGGGYYNGTYSLPPGNTPTITFSGTWPTFNADFNVGTYGVAQNYPTLEYSLMGAIKIKIPEAPKAKPGYEFTGWKVSYNTSTVGATGQLTNYGSGTITPANGAIVQPNASLTPNRVYGDMTFTAQWKKADYNVNLIAGMLLSNPEAASTQAEVTYLSAFKGNIVPPQSTTHEFLGYFSEPEGGGIQFFGADGKPTTTNWALPSANPRLYAAWRLREVPTEIRNGSFENPIAPHWNYMFKQGTVGLEWYTTASDGMIELGYPGLNRSSAKNAYKTEYAAEGEQFAELNANKTASLYQTIDTSDGSIPDNRTLQWGLSHRGRLGTDTMQVWIGSPEKVKAAIDQYIKDGSKVGTKTKKLIGTAGAPGAILQMQCKSPNTAWTEYTGSYTVPAGQTETMFAFISVSTAGNDNSCGNLLDNIYFQSTIPTPTVPVTVHPPVGGSVNVLVNGAAIGTAEGTTPITVHAPVGSKVTLKGYPDASDYTTIGARVSEGGSETFTAAGTGDSVGVELTLEKDTPVEANVLFAKKGYVILDPNGGSYAGSTKEVKMSLNGQADTRSLVPQNASRAGFSFVGWEVALGTEMKTVTRVEYVLEGTTPYMVAYNGAKNAANEVTRVKTAEAGLVLLAKYAIVDIPNLTVNIVLDKDGATLNGLPDKDIYATAWDADDKATAWELPDDYSDKLSSTLDAANTRLSLGTPVAEGFVFDGWKYNGSPLSDSNIVYVVGNNLSASWGIGSATTALSEDTAITITATWKNAACALVLDLNDDGEGTAKATLNTIPTNYTPGEEAELPTPNRRGYEFLGWFDAETGGTEVEKVGIAGQEGDLTLYAHWKTCDHSGCEAKCDENVTCECGTIIYATGHKFDDYKSDGNASCISVGTKTAECGNGCGETDVVTGDGLDSTKHNYGAQQTLAATCITAGKDYKVCSDCGHEDVINTISATNHNFEGAIPVVVTESSCTSTGMSYVECNNDCGHREYDPSPADGHDLPNAFTVRTEATCLAEGLEVKECPNCDYEVTQVIAATEHDWGDWVTTPATCTSAGIETRTCKNNSGHTETRTINPNGHEFGEAGDWIQTDGAHYKVKVCTNDNDGVDCAHPETVDYAAHTHAGDEDDLTEELVCETCGYLIRPAMSAVVISEASGADKDLTYNGSTIDIADYFAIECEGQAEDCFSEAAGGDGCEADYTKNYRLGTGGTGEGTLSGTTLTVTKAGTFKFVLYTSQTDTHIKGEPCEVTITVAKANQAKPNPGKTDATVYGTANGKLTGLKPGTEYIVYLVDKDGNVFSSMTLTADSSGNITGLPSGNYTVVLPGNDLYNDSPVSNVVFIDQPPQPFSLTFRENGGEWVSGYTVPASYQSGSKGIKPALPTATNIKRTGYTFEGWYDNSSFTGEARTALVDSDLKNLTFYAKWSAIDYEVKTSLADEPHGAVTLTGGTPADPEKEGSKHTANYLEVITIELTPETGYQLKANTLTCTKKTGGTVTITTSEDEDGVISFIMPADDVTVSATFEETPERKKAREAIEAAIGGTWTTHINNYADVKVWILETLNEEFADEYEGTNFTVPFTIESNNVDLYDLKPAAYGAPGKEGTFRFDLTINDDVIGLLEYEVAPYTSSNTKGGRITTENILYAGHIVNITAPVINATPNATNNVGLVDGLGEFSTCTEIKWSEPKTNGTFDAEVVYVASVELTVKDNAKYDPVTAKFDPDFIPVVPGGIVSNVSVADDLKSVTFDVTFPETGERVVDKLEVYKDPETPYDMYVTGDELDLDGLVITVTYEDGSSERLPLDKMPGAYLDINDKIVDPTKLLDNEDDDGKALDLNYGGKNVELGKLTVFSPPVLTLSAPYGMKVESGENVATGGEIDFRVVKGSNKFDWSLEIEETELTSGTASNVSIQVTDEDGAYVSPKTESLGAELACDTLYTVTLTAIDNVTKREYPITKTFRSPSAVPTVGEDLKDINIGVIDEYGTGKVKVSLVRGDEILETLILEAQEGGTSYDFKFEGVEEGHYNLVVDNGLWLVTHGVVIDEKYESDSTIMINMNSGKKQSVLELKNKAPVVVVDNLPTLFENKAIYTPSDAAVVDDAGTVEIKLLAQGEEQVSQTEKNAMKAQTSGMSFGMVMDLSVYKSHLNSSGELIYSTQLVNLYGNKLSLEIDAEPRIRSGSGVILMRMSAGVVEEIPMAKYNEDGMLEGMNENGEYFIFSADRSTVTIVAENFGAYAFMYRTPSSRGDLIIEDAVGGNVTANRTSPATNERVTLTVNPEDGYVLDSLVVRDSKGNTVSLKDNGDGTYSFDMPAGGATVTPRFKKDFDVTDVLNTTDHMAYMIGDDLGMFNPGNNMTRAEMAQMFYNLLADKDVRATKSFEDVAADAWYAKAVNVMATMGIVKGFEDGCFYPDEPISRAQFAAVVVRFTEVTGQQDVASRFTDVPKSHWAYDYIGTAFELGLINGVNESMTLFAPDVNITRAEAATMTNRILSRYPDERAIDTWSGIKTFPDLAKTDWYWYQVMEAVNDHDYQKSSDDKTIETWKK